MSAVKPVSEQFPGLVGQIPGIYSC